MGPNCTAVRGRTRCACGERVDRSVLRVDLRQIEEIKEFKEVEGNARGRRSLRRRSRTLAASATGFKEFEGVKEFKEVGGWYELDWLRGQGPMAKGTHFAHFRCQSGSDDISRYALASGSSGNSSRLLHEPWASAQRLIGRREQRIQRAHQNSVWGWPRRLGTPARLFCGDEPGDGQECPSYGRRREPSSKGSKSSKKSKGTVASMRRLRPRSVRLDRTRVRQNKEFKEFKEVTR